MTKRKKALIPVLILISAVLLTLLSEEAAGAARSALSSAAVSIIPSLFPYMVVSSLIVSTGAADIIGRFLPAARLFSLPACASAPVILGAVCGFPLGARSATELYSNGTVDKKEAEVLLSVSNNTGPSFTAGVIGAIYWGDIKIGWIIYFAQLISVAAASFIINRLIFPARLKKASRRIPIIIRPFFESFAAAVRSSAISCVYICGFIVFFSVTAELLSGVLCSFAPTVKAALCSVLEFSRGTAEAAALGGVQGAFLCGFSVGWSGISVFCQTCAFTAPLGLSLRRTVAVKLLQGIFTGLICAVYIGIYPLPSVPAFVTAHSPQRTAPILIILFATAVTAYLLRRKRAKKEENSKCS